MPPKQGSNSKVKKRVRKTITMEVKSKILKHKDRGCSTILHLLDENLIYHVRRYKQY